jgi:hypothetical protein
MSESKKGKCVQSEDLTLSLLQGQGSYLPGLLIIGILFLHFIPCHVHNTVDIPDASLSGGIGFMA